MLLFRAMKATMSAFALRLYADVLVHLKVSVVAFLATLKSYLVHEIASAAE